MQSPKSPTEYVVAPCDRDDIKDFVETHHYSKNINGVISDYCFSLTHGDALVGAIIYGRMAMASQWKKYGKEVTDVIELRRLVCVDDTPKNTESYFISRTIKWLRDNTHIRVIVSYADPEYGHTGVVYRASNFRLHGKSAAGKVILLGGKKYHDKTIRTTYKGKLKPFAERVKQALVDGVAVYKTTQGKNIYTYHVKRKR